MLEVLSYVQKVAADVGMSYVVVCYRANLEVSPGNNHSFDQACWDPACYIRGLRKSVDAMYGGFMAYDIPTLQKKKFRLVFRYERQWMLTS